MIVAIVITAFVAARTMTDTFSARTQSESLEQSRDAPRLADPGAGLASPTDLIATTIYDSSPVILPITWGAVAGTLI
jgi:hypothetical protein